MNIDPLLSLAFAMHETKGGYALLIGSGVSRAAGILTGWEVVLDLISRVVYLEGGTSPADPAAWYCNRYGGEPDYSVLLEALAGTPSERRQLLRGYFEASEDDRAAGAKIPTPAHHAIADLARRGHVRVVLTTNFDRLLEQAMEATGITPAIVSAAEAIDGAMPLVHAAVTVVKLHGDYLDSRLRNTEAELSTYETKVDILLDRVLDEFGLVVCGWSASWDPALRRAIERCPTRRFTTWWAAKGELTHQASGLIAQRRARVVPIESADIFFRQLSERVVALEEMAAPHPATPAVAVAILKRYLVDPTHRIRLHDLVMDEVTRTVTMATTGAAVIPEAPSTTYEAARETIRTRVAALEAASESIVAMLTAGCYWGANENLRLWTKVVERLAAEITKSGSTTWYQELCRYPALLALYAAAMGSMASGNEETAIRLLLEPKITTDSGSVPAVAEINAVKVLEPNAMKQLPGLERRKTPGSDHLFDHLKPVFRNLLPDNQRFEAMFDRFEYLLAMTFLGQKAGKPHSGWAPMGRFAWKRDSWDFSLQKDVEDEAKAKGKDWVLLRLGLFSGSLEDFLKDKTDFDRISAQVAWS